MIKLETIHIEEIRGIRKLDIDLNRGTFAISGPNGSGKSGVVDAIEFGLTGQIGRLTGRGTGGLSVSEHGPHVDKAKFPDTAFIKLTAFLPTINKSVTITRKLSSPTKPVITPADADVLTVLSKIKDHPEITLSRREILRFILIEPAKRSDEIQTILKLDEIGQIRAHLKSAKNKLLQAYKSATSQLTLSQNTLLRHLQIATLLPADILNAVNARRKALGLSNILDFNADTKLDSGLSDIAKSQEFNKESALRDIKALSASISNIHSTQIPEITNIVNNITKLESDAELLIALQRRTLIESGINLIDEPACPLCDAEWKNIELLRQHLMAKLKKSDEAQVIHQDMIQNGSFVLNKIAEIIRPLNTILKLSKDEKDTILSKTLADWIADLEIFKTKMSSITDLISSKTRFTEDWLRTPSEFATQLTAFQKTLEAKPDQTAIIDAQTFLTTAQLRLADYRENLRANKAAEIASLSAEKSYNLYCSILDEELNALYETVEKDFSLYYSTINAEDEATFTAKLTPSEGSLGLDVNFYNRGLFPPAAYHSEGHQDGMGVCLYLALMKHLYGDQFTFALFDDVVMSVDTGHRYQFCQLLKSHFPNTQFIITTHDRLWAEQMKSAGLVNSKSSIAFYSWTIDTGPLVESNPEIWNDISAALSKNKVEPAAAALRHHLEYTSRHLADLLGASPQFRADGNYDLGDLLPPVVSRMKSLYKKAVDAAQSWGKTEEKSAALAKKDDLSKATDATNLEQWAVNKAVHYNTWANFSKNDFQPVVTAFKTLLAGFNCEKCSSWLYATPRINPETLRCNCSSTNINLKSKPK